MVQVTEKSMLSERVRREREELLTATPHVDVEKCSLLGAPLSLKLFYNFIPNSGSLLNAATLCKANSRLGK